MQEVVISAAITGGMTVPTQSGAIPVTPEEIIESAVGAYEAGAAIVHLHARNPADGRPDQSPEAFEPFLRSIKQRCDVVCNLTTGGAPFMTVEERLRPASAWKPEGTTPGHSAVAVTPVPDSSSASASVKDNT